MRIKHTKNESYKVYSYLPNKGSYFKDIKRWFPYKHYSSKQAALNGINNFKKKHDSGIDSRLIFKIIWSPYPFASDEECITVYEECENEG